MYYTWPSVLQAEVLDIEPPAVPAQDHTCCFAGHCYSTHDEAVHAVQHDAPLTLARWMPTDLD